MKISSDVGAAKEAVAGFAALKREMKGEQVALATSTVSGMEDAAKVANGIPRCLSGLTSALTIQADRVTALATEIARRDAQDGQGWCEKP